MTADPTPTTGADQGAALTDDEREALAAVHVMRWTYEDGGARAEAFCLAAPDADCRLTSAGPECDCEWWGRIERRDDGTIWHLLTDGYRDLTLPRDQEQWHRVVPQDAPACNDCGNPATVQLDTGWVIRGGNAHRTWTWACDECAADARRERERSRAS